MITKIWVVECGIGHWSVSNGINTISCDDSELNETIEELTNELD